jgi:hypothetical protein
LAACSQSPAAQNSLPIPIRQSCVGSQNNNNNNNNISNNNSATTEKWRYTQILRSAQNFFVCGRPTTRDQQQHIIQQVAQQGASDRVRTAVRRTRRTTCVATHYAGMGGRRLAPERHVSESIGTCLTLVSDHNFLQDFVNCLPTCSSVWSRILRRGLRTALGENAAVASKKFFTILFAVPHQIIITILQLHFLFLGGSQGLCHQSLSKNVSDVYWKTAICSEKIAQLSSCSAIYGRTTTEMDSIKVSDINNGYYIIISWLIHS